MNSAIGFKETDVVVAGGGTGGVCAAIAAARNGMQVVLVEAEGFLGGLFTGGNMCVSNCMPWAGLGKEIFDELIKTESAVLHPDDPPNYPIYHYKDGGWHTVPYDPEAARLVLFNLAEQAGVKLLLHSFVTGAVVEKNAVRGIVVENKSGRQVVVGKVVCDGTGDGDVAASAGAPFVKGMGEEEKLFAMTMLVRLSHVDWREVTEYSKQDYGWDKAISKASSEGEIGFYSERTPDMLTYWGHPRPELSRLWWEDGALLWGGTVENVDGTDGDSLSFAEAECRRQWVAELEFLKKYIPGFQSARVEYSATSVGVRETRHVVCEYTYTGYDVLEEREFDDTAAYIVPQFLGVPYRCLVPKEIDNLLISSKCISTAPGQSASGPQLGSYNDMKSIPTVMTYGEAAGTAAALCVKNGQTPRELDVKSLQKTLKGQKALLEKDALNRIAGASNTPDGTVYTEYLENMRAERRKRWEQKGYEFSVGSNPRD